MIAKRTPGSSDGAQLKSQLLPNTRERATIIYRFIKLSVFQIKSVGSMQEDLLSLITIFQSISGAWLIWNRSGGVWDWLGGEQRDKERRRLGGMLKYRSFQSKQKLKKIYMHGGFSITVSLFPIDFSLN